MSSTGRSALVLILWLWVFGLAEGAATSPAMVDPLLGLSFDSQQVRFEVLPRSISATKMLGPNPRWIFAAHHDQAADTTYYIAAGFHMVRPDGRGKAVKEPDFGAVVRLAGGRLTVLGVPDRLFESEALLPTDIVEHLMQDAADRYVKAFGGAVPLSQAIEAQGLRAQDLPQILVKYLEEHEVQVHTGN